MQGSTALSFAGVPSLWAWTPKPHPEATVGDSYGHRQLHTEPDGCRQLPSPKLRPPPTVDSRRPPYRQGAPTIALLLLVWVFSRKFFLQTSPGSFYHPGFITTFSSSSLQLYQHQAFANGISSRLSSKAAVISGSRRSSCLQSNQRNSLRGKCIFKPNLAPTSVCLSLKINTYLLSYILSSHGIISILLVLSCLDRRQT